MLKGILKPSAICETADIRIHDNHYDNLSPRQPLDFAQSSPENVSSEISSNSDLTSPEYDPNFDFSEGRGQEEPGRAFEGHDVVYGDQVTLPISIKDKPEIELKDFQQSSQQQCRRQTRDHTYPIT